jgi:hypothetical protein
MHVHADKPVAVIQAADNDGVEATAFWSPAYHARHYGFPIDTQYASVACLSNTSVGLYDAQGQLQLSRNCVSDGNQPGRVYFGSSQNGTHIDAGQYLISDEPVYMIYESSSSNDEKNQFGLR